MVGHNPTPQTLVLWWCVRAMTDGQKQPRCLPSALNDNISLSLNTLGSVDDGWKLTLSKSDWVLWRFCYSGAVYRCRDLLTYLFT